MPVYTPLTARACIPATGPFARLCIQFQGLSHRTFRSHVVAIVFFQPRGGLIYLKDDIIPSLGILIATVEAIPCTNSLNQQKHLPVSRVLTGKEEGHGKPGHVWEKIFITRQTSVGRKPEKRNPHVLTNYHTLANAIYTMSLDDSPLRRHLVLGRCSTKCNAYLSHGLRRDGSRRMAMLMYAFCHHDAGYWCSATQFDSVSVMGAVVAQDDDTMSLTADARPSPLEPPRRGLAERRETGAEASSARSRPGLCGDVGVLGRVNPGFALREAGLFFRPCLDLSSSFSSSFVVLAGISLDS